MEIKVDSIFNENPALKVEVDKNREKFLSIFNNTIKREGSSNLLKWLESSDFFVAPASSKYHLCKPGGLCLHSIHVYDRLVKEYIAEYGKDSLTENVNETLAICGLLHDLCKVNFYKLDTRNKKNEQGKWEKVPYYAIEDTLPYGHGEKSVYIISGFMKLSRSEAMAVRWHMGGFDVSVIGGSFSQSRAFEMFSLATLLHIADLKSTYLDESEAV